MWWFGLHVAFFLTYRVPLHKGIFSTFRQSNKKSEYSHFDGLVPVDDVPAEREGLDVDDVHVAALRAHVHPLRLQRQVQAGDPGEKG